MRRIDQRQLIAGVVFVAIGVTAAIMARRMELGTTTRIGPGGFPLLIATVLTILGIANLAIAFLSRDPVAFSLRESRAAFLIPVSVVAFAFTIEEFGLIPAIVVTVLIAGLAAPRPKAFEMILMAVGISLAGAGIFVYGLGLPFTLINTPWAG